MGIQIFVSILNYDVYFKHTVFGEIIIRLKFIDFHERLIRK